MNTKFFDEMSAKLNEIMQNSPAKDVEKNFRAMLATFFTKLDLVSREEFDVQAQVLLRTREKLSELETRIAALEGKSNATVVPPQE